MSTATLDRSLVERLVRGPEGAEDERPYPLTPNPSPKGRGEKE